MKREKMIVMLLALLLLLSACGSPDSSSTEPSAIPARMVSRLEVSIIPPTIPWPATMRIWRK